MKPRLTVIPKIATIVQPGESLPLELRFTNPNNNACVDLAVSLAEESFVQVTPQTEHLDWLDKSESKSLEYRVTFAQRGIFNLPDVLATTVFPLGLFANRQAIPSRKKIVVAPAYRPIAFFDESCFDGRASHGSNEHAMMSQNSQTEYCGSREYVPEMPVRRWDFSSWARLGEPVVREFTDESNLSAKIYIDNLFRFDDRTGESELFESMVSLAAAIVDALLSREISVDSIASLDGRTQILTTKHSIDRLSAMQFLAGLATQAVQRNVNPRLSELHSSTDATFVILHSRDEQPAKFWRTLAENQRPFIPIVVGDARANTPEFIKTVTVEEIAAGTVRL